MQGDIERILLDAGVIADRLDDLARQITADIEQATGIAEDSDPHNTLTIVPVMTGSIIFVADLVRRLPLRMQIFPMSASSYPGTATESTGKVEISDLSRLPDDLTGHHILLVDDILDSGRTLQRVTEELKRRGPATMHTCVLLRKQRPEAMDFPVDYVAFDIPDAFVVGYGLDYDDQYRNLPNIVTLRPEVANG
ncbi:hypoxanthine phosphoribosyltransferase [Phycisphaeraceae bacterium D3-23]